MVDEVFLAGEIEETSQIKVVDRFNVIKDLE